MIRIAAFRVHKNDPLGALIQADTRGPYTHIAIETDRATRTIVEAYYPHVRRRILLPSELQDESGNWLIDFFTIRGLTLEIEAKLNARLQEAIDEHERYSIEDLFRFSPFFRLFLGEAKDSDPAVICSAFAHHQLAQVGIVLLNAHSYEIDPYRLTWSPLLVKDTP